MSRRAWMSTLVCCAVFYGACAAIVALYLVAR